MEAPKPEKKKLSKSILQMKFMKRSKEQFEKEKDEEEGRAMFASEVTDSMRKGGSQIVMEHSFVPCEDLLIGRQSFHGMNPEIEKLNGAGKLNDLKKENDEDITDMEMARRYTTLIDNINYKFKSKKSRNMQNDVVPMKKPKFMKPSDD